VASNHTETPGFIVNFLLKVSIPTTVHTQNHRRRLRCSQPHVPPEVSPKGPVHTEVQCVSQQWIGEIFLSQVRRYRPLAEVHGSQLAVAQGWSLPWCQVRAGLKLVGAQGWFLSWSGIVEQVVSGWSPRAWAA